MRDIVRLKTERELVRITIDDGDAFWKETGVNAVEESLNVTFDETPPLSKTSPLEDDDLVEEEAIK
ncbi:hypothetical protein Tco_1549491, partial [Tanacetum coccineum]